MKKILIFIALTIGFMWSIAFVLLPSIESKIENMAPIESTGAIDVPIIEEEISNSPQEKIDSKEIVRGKIETIRKRLALKGLIIEGDSYYRDGQLPLALKKYLEFYKKNPADALIIEKLGDTYFEMHKFSSANNYYSKIPEPSGNIKEKNALSLALMTRLTDESSIVNTLSKLESLNLKQEELFYYNNSLSCINDFHICKKDFGEYFWPVITEDTPELSENTPTEKEIGFMQLANIKNAITNYVNFQVDDVYLKDAYIIGSWYSDGFYNLSAYMGEKLLEEKVDYKPILKIVAQSYFELGKYEEARDALGKYYEIDDKDPGVTYLLGVVNTKLREYVLANIYFNKSLELGYKNQNSIYKQLIHNFYVLENDEKMLESFVSLIKNGDFSQSDLSLGIYYHIIHEQYPQALTWAQKGKELFASETGNFHTYEGWILTEKGDYEEARSILQEGLEIDGENPFVLINFGYNALGRGQKGEALIYFKKVISLSSNTEFAVNAREEIEKLSKK